MSETTIGFVGLGIMGAPMATHLLNAGYEVVGYDISPSRVESLVTLGAQAGLSSKDVTSRSEVVISMVPDSPDVEAVYLSKDGVLDVLILNDGARKACCSSTCLPSRR